MSAATLRSDLSAPSPSSVDTPSPGEEAKIRVFLIDDHDVVREGLVSILGHEPDIQIVGEADSAEEALHKLPEADPDVVILDYRLPGMNGSDLCREIAERRLRAQVVMLSAYLDESIVDAAMMAGARAYVVKDVEAGELKRAIRSAARGQTTVDPKVVGRILSWAARLAPRAAQTLRPAEMQILRLLAEGKSNQQIAAVTGLSPNTVKSYLREIYAKLGANSRASAAAIALRRGLV